MARYATVDGVLLLNKPAGLTSNQALQAGSLVGREVLETLDKEEVPSGEIVLEMQGVSAVSDRGVTALDGVDLRIRSGQIIGLAGVAGNGQSELAEVITGLRECTGSIQVNGAELANRPVSEAIDAGAVRFRPMMLTAAAVVVGFLGSHQQSQADKGAGGQ